MTDLNRRDALRRGGAGLILATLGGALGWVTPAAAAAGDAPFRTLTPGQGAWLAALGDAIAPGAAAAGIAHFVDHHITVPPAESLLALRYLDAAPPYADFYRAALDALARHAGAVPPPAGDPRWTRLLGELAAPIAGWQGPPPPFFLFAVRLDAVDMAYGTRAGFARLGVEYLAHVEPETDW